MHTPKSANCLHQTFILIIILLSTGFAFGYSGGTGEPNNPYQIATPEDLNDINNHPEDFNKCFILTADINLSGYVFTTAVIAPFNGTGPAFIGTFNGAGHKIRNLTIQSEAGGLGLFGHIKGGEVNNLGLENVDISSNQQGSACIGGLAGSNEGSSISNSYSTGIVKGWFDSISIGGLVGSNQGSIINCYSSGIVTTKGGSEEHFSLFTGGLVGQNYYGTIGNCYSICSVTGGDRSFYQGGLVGQNCYGSTINNCYSISTVTNGTASSQLGGLVGDNGGPISKCYSTGNVNSGYNSGGTGGLVGSNSNTISESFSTSDVNSGQYTTGGGLVGMSSGDINNCYSKGSVSCRTPSWHLGGLVGSNGALISNSYSTGLVTGGAEYIGGLVGENYHLYGIINSSYFLDTSGPDNGFGTPLTDAQMKHQASFIGWDFVGETINGTEDIWWILEGVTYPKFAWYWYDPNNPNGSGHNIGEYADFDQNGIVNFLDFAIFAAAWQTENPFISLDTDTDADIYDLKIFCEHWLLEQ